MVREELLRRRVRKVAEQGAFLVAQKENILYLSGTEAATYMVVPLDGEPVLLVPRLELDRAMAESWIGDVRGYQDGQTPLRKGEKCMFFPATDALAEVLKEMKITAIRFDHLGQEAYSELSEFTLARSKILEDMRMIKSREEIRLIQRAREIAADAYLEVCSDLDENLTELDLAARIYTEIMSRGAMSAFEPIVAFGERSALPHSIPGPRKISSCSLILIDLGARVGGYCSDITRTILTAPGPAEQSLELVRSALNDVIDHLVPGMPLSEADHRARQVLGSEATCFIHRLGHGIGLQVHEAPTLSPTSSEKLRDGMVFTVEPGLYYKGRYGVRWEEDLFCWKGKVRMI